MQRYVAFLRGINLGNRRVSMARLAKIFESLGHSEVGTFIASGNVLFSSRRTGAAALEKAASAQLERDLGYKVEVMIRTAAEVIAITEATPFPDEKPEGINIFAGLLKEEPSPEEARKLENVRTETDRFRVIGREFYWLCRTGMSQSKVWTLPEAKAVRLPAVTVRNMTTLRKLAVKHLSR